MFTSIDSPLGSIRTYEANGLKWFVAKDILMDAIGYRNMTDLLTKVDKEEKNKMPLTGGGKITVLTSEGLRQCFNRTISSKEQFNTMREWAIEQGYIRPQLLNTVESATQLYLNGFVLYGLSFSLLLMRPLTSHTN
ncbi:MULTISPECIES: BRO family protein [Bacillus cereus group]|uniref:BRO family protein n=1 Tax=Bacillus cereus group TaxID=86661 RepID=UPI0022E28BFE|nr:BRO family protein [Bacillus paranthracis]MED1136636.1 BRO family protein [Bacillus paranthracis]